MASPRRVRFTTYARLRMRQRDILEDEVARYSADLSRATATGRMAAAKFDPASGEANCLWFTGGSGPAFA